MYNLLVTYEAGAWDASHCKYELNRVFECTVKSIREKYQSLSETATNKLMSFPCLFAYEGHRGDYAYIGRIKRIDLHGNLVTIEYKLDRALPPIPATALSDLRFKLDIENIEMNRTHWAVKNKDLLGVLSDAGLIKQKRSKLNKTEYDVALSYASEDRDYVEKVADTLKAKGVRVFYDKHEIVSLWGKNLYDYLSKVYSETSKYTVMFISKHYKNKNWTNHEREAAQARAFADNREYILPVRFDDTQLPGMLSTVTYVSANELKPEELADLIIEKLKT